MPSRDSGTLTLSGGAIQMAKQVQSTDITQQLNALLRPRQADELTTIRARLFPELDPDSQISECGNCSSYTPMRSISLAALRTIPMNATTTAHRNAVFMSTEIARARRSLFKTNLK